jgi:uncharacterized protein (TIGR02599 family)
MGQLKYSRHKAGYRQGRGAFTLAELLVAIAVLSILVLLLCGILNQVSSTWSEIRAQIDRHQNGRSILNVMASELRVAALPQDRSNKLSLQMVVDPYFLLPPVNASTNPQNYLNPHAIFWQAPIATVTSSGNMAEVGYFVNWDTTNSNNPRATLCQFFVNPGDPNYLIYQSTPAPTQAPAASANPTNPWLNTTVLSSVVPTPVNKTTNPNYKGWFADNVIGLWVRCLDANGVPIVRTAAATESLSATTNYSFDSRLGYEATDAGAGVASTSGTYSLNYIPKSSYNDAGVEHILCTLPSTVEIAIVVIDAQTANYVTAVPNYTNTAFTYSSYGPPSHEIAPQGNYASPPAAGSPVNFWNDINVFLANLKTAQYRVWQGAHVYSIRVPLANGG